MANQIVVVIESFESHPSFPKVDSRPGFKHVINFKLDDFASTPGRIRSPKFFCIQQLSSYSSSSSSSSNSCSVESR